MSSPSWTLTEMVPTCRALARDAPITLRRAVQ
jgi:hypothetical protein